jgi:arginase
MLKSAIMNRRIELLINTSELTAGTRGASLGPGAIMSAARKSGNNFFGRYPKEVLPDFNASLDFPTNTPFAKYIFEYTNVFHAIADRVKEKLHAGAFPILLSADHGSAAGTIAGIKAANPSKKLGVVWIDAHGDLHSPYTTPSGNIHGMPLAICLNTINPDKVKNDLDENTIKQWADLCQSHGIAPKITPENLVFVGVRDTELEEDHLISSLAITNHTIEDVRENGIAAIASQILTQLSDCDAIYISFDVDSMDPHSTSFGTGTPVGNGLFPEEATELLTLLTQNEKTVCLEIVEVNPCLDNKLNTMAETTFDILNSVVNAITNN